MKLALALEKHEYKGINKVPHPVYTIMYLLDAAVRLFVRSFICSRDFCLVAACYVLGPISGAEKNFLSKRMNIFWDSPFQMLSGN